ncbi:MAG: OmpA family protein [Verrucomicrobia bacterium]|nr:OmpA family protein [Verrucomicrobiota bacterium]
MVPDAAAFAPNTVHFAYDSASIASKETAKIKEVAVVLRGQPANKVVIDGHCDERGTEEYNRALGERRALSIREKLIKEGISADRIYTRTFGKDKPVGLGHDESARSQNRRGEFILLRPPTGAGARTP